MERLAFVYGTSAIVKNAIESRRKLSPITINRPPSTRKSSRALHRIHPTSNTPPPPPPPPPPPQQPEQQQHATNWASRTVIGRLLVEVLSLIVGTTLLLAVLVWRLSQIVSLNFVRALAWISNVRQLGKWAFTKLARLNKLTVHVASLSQTLTRIYSYAFSRTTSSSTIPTTGTSSSDKRTDTKTTFTSTSSTPTSTTITGNNKMATESMSKSSIPSKINNRSPSSSMADRKDDTSILLNNNHETISSSTSDTIPKSTRRRISKQSPIVVQGRRLILLRHAKTEWSRDSRDGDHERELSIRGREEARIVGEELRRIGWIPDTILSSDAMRTVQTLDLLKMPESVVNSATRTDCLYFAVSGEEMAMAVDDALVLHSSFSTLLVVCHNPGCEELVQQLTGCRLDMGTACAALLEINQLHRSNASHVDEIDGKDTFTISTNDDESSDCKWSLAQLIRPSTLMTANAWSDDKNVI